jgi:hypothetical protein|tara:strand:+ start:394 stop:642 length:249 start_codon:yes stop_codon:yes gene_type:complete
MKKFSLALIAATSTIMAGPAVAYPPVESEACIANALESVYSKGLSSTLKDVQDYCHCALTKIMDEGKPIASSLDYCNKKYIL